MACFDDLIALRNNCAGTVPTSGFYADEIGINIPLLNDFTTEAYTDGEDLFEKKLDFARALMVSQIRTQFSNKYRTLSVIDGDRIGFVQENKTERAAAAQYRGIEIELCNNDTYVDFYLSSLDLFLNYTGNLTLVVFDLLQGRQIDTIAVTGITAGEKKTVYPNKTYKSDRQKLHLFIAYDATAVASYDVTVGTSGCTTCGSSGTVALNDYLRVNSQYMELADDPIDQNLVGLGHTGGISMTYSMNCNHEDWLCEKRSMLALPLLYKVGSEILQHGLNNWDDINSAVLVHRDKIEERQQDLEMKFVHELDSVLKKLRVPSNNVCFSCSPRSVTRTILP